MKTKITFLLICVLSSLFVNAQTPQKFNYQAAVRNSSGTPIINKQIGVKILIHESSATGTVEYEETHTPTTNAYGVFSIQVGSGVPVSGVFNSVSWDANQHFIETSIDVNGGTSFKTLGTNELVSVPYALHARTVENDKVNDADADSTNEIQTMIKVGRKVSLSNNGGSFTDEVYDGDSSQTNEIQSISKSGSIVTLSNGGGSFADAVNDADASATNELQKISRSSTNIVLSNGGGSVSVEDADANPMNEIQSISKSGSTVTLSNGGGSFTDAVNDADASTTNEIQTISISGNQITLSRNGGNFTVADADSSTTNEIQSISKSGTTVTLSNGGGSFTDAVNDADASTTNEIQTISATATDLELSKNGGSIPFNNLNFWKKSGNNIYESSRNVGIGTSSPKNLFHVSASKADTSLGLFYNTNTGSGAHAVKGIVGANNVETVGYLGVTSKVGFDNNPEIIFPSGNGMEIGVLGVTTSGSGNDNIAIMGHTNGGRAAYFKNSSAKTQVSIGVTNYGIYIDTGRLYVQDDAIVNGGLGVKKDAIIDGNLQVKKDVLVDGGLGVSQYIIHQSDNDTYLNFTSDRLTTVVGNYAMIDVKEDGSSSYISFAPPGVNSGFGGIYSDAKLRAYSIRGEDNQFALIAENTRSSNNLTIGSFSKAKNTGAYNQSVYGAYNTSTNGCNATGSRWSYGSWNYAEVSVSSGTSASYGVVGSVSSSDNSNVRYAGYFLGNVYASAYATPSDQNLKTNISSSSSSLEKILALPIKTYEYKTYEYMQMNLPKGIQTGIMAQDLEVLFPVLVTKALQPPMSEIEQESLTNQGVTIPSNAKKEVEFKAVNYNGLIPHLTSAIQEQQKIIQSQNDQIKTQEQVNASQTEELNALKAELEKQRKLLLELQALLTK